MPSFLEQYRVSDFLDWYEQKKLILNPDFQRGSVWTPAARSYLINTILKQLSMPKVYLRTIIRADTRSTVREVVDGQQRLRTIIDFAANQFVLSKRAGEFAGLKYSTLDPELQQTFLGYAIAVDQLVNASNDDVLEVFARLNSYSVRLNPPETRHAMFHGEFKFAVRNASAAWGGFWDGYDLFTTMQRTRMMDDSLTAEMFGILVEGVKDGGQPKIDALYKKYDGDFDAQGKTRRSFDKILNYIQKNFAEGLKDSPLLTPTHFLLLFAAIAHALIGIPKGELELIPNRSKSLKNLDLVRDNLLLLSSLIQEAEAPEKYLDFWQASKSSTQRISSRRIRFKYLFRALESIRL